MSISNPYAQYQSNQVSMASPEKLLLMAYDGAIRFARVGLEKMREGVLDEKSSGLGRAQSIIAELLAGLNPEHDPELVSNLARLYEYMFNRLSVANLNDDERAAAEVIGMLVELRESWAQAAESLRAGAQAAGAKR